MKFIRPDDRKPRLGRLGETSYRRNTDPLPDLLPDTGKMKTEIRRGYYLGLKGDLFKKD